MADPTATPDSSSTSDQMLNQIIQQLLSRQSGSNTATDVGQVLGGAAAGRATGVNQQNQTALQGGALSNQLYQSALQRALAQAALPNFRAQQAVTGDQIANVQDVVPTGPANVMAHVVNFTGGRRPSNLGPNARAAGAALSGIGASNIGKDVLPASPTMPAISNGGVLGNILGGGSLAASLIGALTGKGGSGGAGSPGGGGSMDLGKLFASLLQNKGNPPTGDPYGANPWGAGGPSISNTFDPTQGASSGVMTGLPGSGLTPEELALLQQTQGGGGGDVLGSNYDGSGE